MAKGENIFKRKDGRWEARYIKGYLTQGKIRYGYCYGKTYKEAKEKVTKFKAAPQVDADQKPSDKGILFAAFCDEWLSSSAERVKESTYIKYMTAVERYIKQYLGNYCPGDIDSSLIRSFTHRLGEYHGLQPKTVKDILIVLRSVLKYTAKQSSFNFSNVEICYPKAVKTEMRVLSEDEQKALISYLVSDIDECRFGILFALFTGIRIGEICALKWDNISMEEKTVRISSTMQRLKDLNSQDGPKTKIVIGTPKSDTSARIIPITDQLAVLCEKMKPNDPTSFLLTGCKEYMEPRKLQYRLKKYMRECGLDGVHFHTLRHTFATKCVEVGFEIKTLSEILGHSSTTITLDRYVHSSIELKRSNMNKLSAVGW